jgi:hypothetical protein
MIGPDDMRGLVFCGGLPTCLGRGPLKTGGVLMPADQCACARALPDSLDPTASAEVGMKIPDDEPEPVE